MKRRILFFTTLVALGLLTSCEKAKESENYSPWPSAAAQEAWTNYTPDRLYDKDAYNSVATTMAFLGTGFNCHDSILVRYSDKDILLCGYLTKRSYAIGDATETHYYLSTNPKPMPGNVLTIYYMDHAPEEIDSTKIIYVKARVTIYDTQRYYESYPTARRFGPPCSQLYYCLSYAEIININ